MRHHIFEENTTYKTTILIKESSFRKSDLITSYVFPLSKLGVEQKDLIAFSLNYNEAGKAPVKLIKGYLITLLKALQALGVDTIYCADAAYFKVLTKQKQAEKHMGYVLPCAIEGYEYMQVILGVNHSSIFYNPNNQISLDLSLDTLGNHIGGTFTEIGLDIIKDAKYLSDISEIRNELHNLHSYEELTADIETFSLKHYNAGLGTIGFAWDLHSGSVLRCDYEPCEPYQIDVWDKKDKKYKKKLAHGKRINNTQVKAAIRDFLEKYEGKLIWHNAAYDIKVLIYVLWMEEDITNHAGLLRGLEIMTRHFDCTKLITYLATNSCAGNKLSLKDIAHEFAGNYGQGEDIKDIRLMSEPVLMKYNLIDCLSTWYAEKKNRPIMIQDKQEELYEGLFKESLITIIQMELTGMPMCMKEILRGESELQGVHDLHHGIIQAHPQVKEAIKALQLNWIEKDFEDRLAKAKNPEKLHKRVLKDLLMGAPASFPRGFNPNSGPQMATLLHEVMGLPIIETTDTGLPAADDDTLKALINHTSNESFQSLIKNIRGQLGVDKILTTFIPAFKEVQLGKDGIYYLFGSFNLGGTKSGRLSSSNPNLQNIPSGSTYAKIVKSMFRGNTDWLFGGADFASLEDYISALTTKDPNKLKVYIDGYDGHCLRAYSYFGDQMPDIPNTVSGINSIKKAYDNLRYKSKAPTFLLTYGGTYHGLMKNCGFDELTAKDIEAKYHELYKVSDDWVQAKLVEATKTGYVEVAFGLKLRTPLLERVILNNRKTPYEAKAEGRTAGNALGQSYGLLNCRAANEFMKRVRASEYRLDIRLCAQIHDAIYLLMRNELGIIEWANKNLTECMAWQDLPELKHDTVKLHAELDLFYPSWEHAITLPDTASIEEIHKIASDYVLKL